jgi:phospholipase C
VDISTLPTIWDRLAAKSLRARYYSSDVPFLGLWGLKYLPIMRPVSDFYADCAAGRLPAVSYVDPRLLGEQQGLSNDDHPHADIRNGQVFLNDVYNAVTRSPNWRNTVLVITYDEWGGFFDHVPPAAAPIPPASAAAGDTDGLRGFRVPTFIISPWSQAEVSHEVFDHTSILKMIEWRWHIEPLTIRDATANNLALALDFGSRNLNAPSFAVPPGPYGFPCSLNEAIPNDWDDLLALVRSLGIL